MALGDNPRTSGLLAILLAVIVGYIGYTGDGLSLVGVSGLQARTEQVTALEDSVAVLEASIDSARQELARGSVEEIRQRVEQYRSVLTVLREFVPEQSEVPNLLDDIISRAKVRGVNLSAFAPQPVLEGPAPFDTHAYEVAVLGRYDQIGIFLSDVAGLRRIFVPVELTMTAADQARARALGDTTGALLEARFKVRTYVKSPGGLDGM